MKIGTKLTFVHFTRYFPPVSYMQGYNAFQGYAAMNGYKRPGYNRDEDEDCQYHTIINGDSEVLLSKILPFRMVGRTILRHCMPKP